MDTSQFKEVFAAEARDYLQSLNDGLLQLENDPTNSTVLDDMFRAAHSLKGMSGTMGFTELAQFTHEMESVLDLLRIGKLRTNQKVFDVLFISVDTLEALLEQTVAGEDIDPPTKINMALRELSEQEKNEPSVEVTPAKITMDLNDFDRETIKQAITQGLNPYEIHIRLRPNTVLKSVRVFTIFQALEDEGTIIKANPSAQDLEEERFEQEFTLLCITPRSADVIREIIEGISEIEKVVVTTVQLEGDSLAEQEILQAAATAEELIDMQTSAKVARGRGSDKFVRIETDRLDKLINLVGELVISRTQVVEISKKTGDSDQNNVVAQLDRVTTELQHAAMNLRMVPIKQVFDRFPRMVRDLARSSNKEINLEIEGEETELDRSLVNQIGDPLVHLIRNSIDHGIESPELRKSQGKSEIGTIKLSARHEGSHILIIVEDDGQGLDVDRIRQKAIERGLITEEQQTTVSHDEAVDLLFHPGFSTADNVTDISGRGVGMDAVKAVVDAMSGTIDVESTTGESLKIIIKLPLTLAILKALLVAAGGETYAIPIQAVRENIQVELEQVKSVRDTKVIVLRDEIVPLYDLAECLGFSPIEQSTDEDSLSVIILETRGQKAGFIVEDLIGQQEIVIKSLGDFLGDIKGIAGATVLGNGEVALILDNSTLIR